MEKRTPHCTLAVVKTMAAAGKVRATFSALAGGAALGFGFEEIVGVVASLTPRYARRSSRLARRLPAEDAGRRCLSELTVIGDLLIVSFKEL